MIEKLNDLKIGQFHLFDAEDFNVDNIKKLKPKKIFFPHWSKIIPEEIFSNTDCVIFHMTDLPFGRGGSPLQNLISRGIYKTKISALKCTKELDGGPIYLKKDLALSGNAAEILNNCSIIIYDMIIDIVSKNLEPVAQKGEVVMFKRRTPSESNLENIEELTQIYDYIRMLDAEGYPHAFVETNEFIFEFTNAQILKDEVTANVRIRKKHK